VIDVERLAWADAYPGQGPTLGEIFCLTFVKGVDTTEALRRMGGLFDTVAVRALPEIGDQHTFDNGYPELASAVELDGWTVLLEPGGFEGSHLVEALSQGTEAVSVLRHDYASPTFEHAVDGTLVVRFDPTFPAYRYGSDPDRLVPLMREVGFVTEDDEDDDGGQYDNAISRSLMLTERLTAVLPTFDMLTGPLASAHFEPWFSRSRKPLATRATRGPSTPSPRSSGSPTCTAWRTPPVSRTRSPRNPSGSPRKAHSASTSARGSPSPGAPAGRSTTPAPGTG